jgi:hypothetical protein
MRPVMTITLHIGYTEGSLYRELSLPGGSGVGMWLYEPETARRSCSAAERWTRETSHDKVMARVL